MNSTKDSGDEFLKRLADIVNENLTNRQFGVSMLAGKMGMSRANLHRKVNSLAKISASQFIRQERLKRAKALLRTTSETVSEVAYEVGFNNVSYFIKCFHEYYGYSPGEVGQRDASESNPGSQILKVKKRIMRILVTSFSATVLVLILIIVFRPFLVQRNELERSIAVLPPYFESQDSGYCKPINGIVQNIIDNLQLISDIAVTPWMSVLQYRNTDKSAPEIAAELKVNYLVKPSILTYESKIQLKMAMIEGKKDNQIWTQTYDIDIDDLTRLYQEISKDIALQIKAEITPEEEYRIEKQITSSGKALNFYNEGVDLINLWGITGNTNFWDSAIVCFENALKFDSTCASAYAQLARMYRSNYMVSYRSGRKPEESHREKIYELAEKANLYDPDLDLTLIAKSLYNRYVGNYELAIAYLRKALEYNPNSHLATYFLIGVYATLEEWVKVLEVSFQALNSNILSKDNSGDALLKEKWMYHRIGIAYQQLGFLDRALIYADTLLVIDPDFIPAVNLKSRILGNLRDYRKSVALLSDVVEKGRAKPATYELLGIYYYMLRDFSSSALYYNQLLELREKDEFSEYSIAWDAWHIALVLINTGETEKAQKFITEQFENPYFQDPQYRSYSLIGYYALTGDTLNAMEQLRIFSGFNNISLGQIRSFENAPVYDNFQKISEFRELISEMEKRYWEKHERIKKELEIKGLL